MSVLGETLVTGGGIVSVFGGVFGYYWSRPVSFAAFRGRIVLSDDSALVRLVGKTRRAIKQFGIMRDGESL